MCLLRSLLRFVHVGALRQILASERLADVVANLRQGLLRKMRRVGAHVGDETDLADARDLHALIQLLGHAHRPLGTEPQRRGGGGLQAHRNKGSRRLGLRSLRVDRLDPVARGWIDAAVHAAQRLGGPLAVGVVRCNDLDVQQAGGLRDALDVPRKVLGLVGRTTQLELLAVQLDQLRLDRSMLAQPGVLRLERGRIVLLVALGHELPPHLTQRRGRVRIDAQHHRHAPVFFGDEGADLVLALDDHAQGDRLDSARTQAPCHLLPQEGRDLVAHDPIEDPPGLLRVDLEFVDAVGIAEGPLDLGARDGVEDHPLGELGIDPQHLRQVPCDRLSLSVEVRRKPHIDRFLSGLLELGDDLLLGRQHLIRRPEMILDVNARHRLLTTLRRPRGKITHVTDRCAHDEVVAQIAIDRPSLGRRLHDDQMTARGAGLGRAALAAALGGAGFPFLARCGCLGHQGVGVSVRSFGSMNANPWVNTAPDAALDPRTPYPGRTALTPSTPPHRGTLGFRPAGDRGSTRPPPHSPAGARRYSTHRVMGVKAGLAHRRSRPLERRSCLSGPPIEHGWL